MKKNKIMRLASALLVLTLMTTCAISSTFAKYTTSTTGNDSARVAYWGFNQAAATNIDLFDDTYDGTVKGENGANVIAPGTKKTTTFAFGYDTNANATKPEVAYTLKVDADVTGTTTDLDANPSFKWTLKKGDETAAEYNTVAELTAAIKKLSGDSTGTKRYEAGTLPAAFTSADEIYTIGWEWKFEDPSTTPAAVTQQDVTDTAMGNATTLDNVNLKITITATQVD